VDICVELSNLGPLRSAQIHLADLTLLIGDNNTGKTFAATVIHRVLGTERWEPAYGRNHDEVPPQLAQQINELAEKLDHRGMLQEDYRLDLDDTSCRWLRIASESMLKAYGESVRESVAYAYGSTPRRLRRRTASRHASDCFLTIKNTQPKWHLEIRFDSDEVKVSPPDPHDLLSLDNLYSSDKRRRLPIRFLGKQGSDLMIARFLRHMLDEALFISWPTNPVHLPADRTGIMQSHNTLAGAAVRQAARAGLRPIKIDTLPGTSADFLSLVLAMPEYMENFRGRKSNFSTEVLKFEEYLGTTIDLDHSSDGLDAIVANTPEGRFPMSRSSSMLSELAPLLLALKAPGLHVGHLTIDEPEAHLHPEMQIQVASFLATLVEKGLRILLTTHSDFFVSQINNMMRRRELAKHNNGTPTPEGPSLERSRVRALRFQRHNGWCNTSELKSDRLNGVDESTFTDVMREQYFETAELVNGLLEQTPN